MELKEDITSRYSVKTIKYEYYGSVDLSTASSELKDIVVKKTISGFEKSYIYGPYIDAILKITDEPIPKPSKYKKLKDYLKK